MIHDFDPRIQAHRSQALWHADPNFEAVMLDLIEQTQPNDILETGTHMGWTCDWFARLEPTRSVSTVEIDPDYYRLATENLAGHGNVGCFRADSADWVAMMVRSHQAAEASGLHVPWRPLFWLDAHWRKPVPLRSECASISKLDRYVCVIDDFECKDPDFAGDGGEETFGFKMCNLEYVSEFLGRRCWRPNYESKAGYKGFGIFLRNVDYVPHALVKEDVLP